MYGEGGDDDADACSDVMFMDAGKMENETDAPLSKRRLADTGGHSRNLSLDYGLAGVGRRVACWGCAEFGAFVTDGDGMG
ncbi:hypothetical protein Tco_0540740 [Tanacetum coccineum]